MSGIEQTDYGFTFGAAEVTRLADFGGTSVIRVAGDDGKPVDIYVSPRGKSVRVFRDGKELKA